MSLPKYETYKPSGIDWIGEVPAHWEVEPLRRMIAAPLANGIFKKKDEFGAGTPLINVFDIYRNDFVVSFETLDRVACTSSEIAAYQVSPGDLFFVRSSLKADGIAAVAIAGHCSEATVFECHLVRARPNPNLIYSRFASYLLNSTYYRSMMVAKAKITTMTTVDQEAILSIPLLIPRLSEQHAIAAFLDREAARIDALVEEQQRLVELLKEKRQAVIRHAITEGLDPTRNIKKSGFDPDQFLPVDWMERRLSTICAFKSGKAHEPHFNDDGPYVCVTARFVSTDGNARKRCSQNFAPACKGDILMVMSDLPNGRALARAFLVDDETPYAVNQRVCAISVLKGNPRFFFYQLNRHYQLLRHDDGVNQTHLPNEAFTRLLLRVPPLSEQDAIVTFLDEETSKIDTLVGETESAISLLQERRAGVISAAVTGKIDVREVLKDQQRAA
jgi:type I restriction enzyme S subunit